MTPSKQIEELIGRLEKASGPDRELDAEIEIEIGCPNLGEKLPALVRAWRHVFDVEDDGSVIIYHALGNKTAKKWRRYKSAHYTSSIDAALTLVPEGFRWRVERYNTDETKCNAELAEVGQIRDFGIGIKTRAQANGFTPAIALSIASLRARLAILSKEEA